MTALEIAKGIINCVNGFGHCDSCPARELKDCLDIAESAGIGFIETLTAELETTRHQLGQAKKERDTLLKDA